MGAGTGAVMVRSTTRAMAWGLALSLTAMLAACGGGEGKIELGHAGAHEAPSANPAAKDTDPAPVRVQLPVNDWTGDDGQHVVRNTTDWAAVWPLIQWLDGAAPPLPHIDFKQHMLVGVTSSYGGCSGGIAITGVALEAAAQGSEWVVHFQLRDTRAAPGALCSDDMKPVADFILLPQSVLPVRFVELPRLH